MDVKSFFVEPSMPARYLYFYIAWLIWLRCSFHSCSTNWLIHQF